MLEVVQSEVGGTLICTEWCGAFSNTIRPLRKFFEVNFVVVIATVCLCLKTQVCTFEKLSLQTSMHSYPPLPSIFVLHKTLCLCTSGESTFLANVQVVACLKPGNRFLFFSNSLPSVLQCCFSLLRKTF